MAKPFNNISVTMLERKCLISLLLLPASVLPFGDKPDLYFLILYMTPRTKRTPAVKSFSR